MKDDVAFRLAGYSDRHQTEIDLFYVNGLAVYLCGEALAVWYAEKHQFIAAEVLVLRAEAVVGVAEAVAAVLSELFASLAVRLLAEGVALDRALEQLRLGAVERAVALLCVARDV